MDILKNSEKRWLRYDFSAVEIHDMSMDLANKTQKFAEVEREKKSSASAFASRLTAISADLGLLSNKVASGYETREVECEILYHKPEQGKKTVIRLDDKTKTIEKMTSEEWNLFNQEGLVETDGAERRSAAKNVLDKIDEENYLPYPATKVGDAVIKSDDDAPFI